MSEKLVITTVPDMSEDVLSYIEKGFSDMLGDICVERRTDPELIGGFTAAYGGKFWDMSIRTQLRRMTEHIEGGVEK